MSAARTGGFKSLTTLLGEPQRETGFVISRQLIKSAAQGAVAEEMAQMRSQLDAQLQQAIEDSVNSLIKRVVDAAVKVVDARVAERTASIAEDARQSYQAAAEKLDGKIRKVVEEAVAARKENPHNTPSRRKRQPRT